MANSMTRKHFNALAEMIRDIHWEETTYPANQATQKDITVQMVNRDELIDRICTLCREFNGKFSRDRFIEACRKRYL